MIKLVFLILILEIYGSLVIDKTLITDEDEATRILQKVNERERGRRNRAATVEWNYSVNLTDYNLHRKIVVETANAGEEYEDWKLISQFKWQDFKDYDLKRQFKIYSVLGIAALPKDKLERNNEIVSKMQSLMQMTTICDFYDHNKCYLTLEPDLTEVMSKSRNEPELRHAWLQFRNSIGPKVRNIFPEYVELQNEIARLNNFTDMADYWLHSYESPDMKEQIFQLWEELKPLYIQLHAYVRSQLRRIYGEHVVSESGPIPAHLLGNMWAQNWGNIAQDTLPFPAEEHVDITGAMLAQGYTVKKMFKMAEDFYISINMSAMPEAFWQNSVLEKAPDRKMICHASAWDFASPSGNDYRIKQCTRVNEKHFITVHHEMGHVQYYINYNHLPPPYRGGANNGFHEAIGDTIAISVLTRKHQYRIGLLSLQRNDDPTQINQLYRLALDKVGFLPFGLMIDLWRWELFEGKIKPETYNCRWWELRQLYQGVEPPVDRSLDDFDPASKFHIVANIPYLRYFVAHILQFQFHRTLCEIAGQYVYNDPEKPLHECDIYESIAAGNALKKMLAMGMSLPWMDALESLTGNRHMDATGLLNYFRPLQKWLEKANKKNGAFIGWKPSLKKASCNNA